MTHTRLDVITMELWVSMVLRLSWARAWMKSLGQRFAEAPAAHSITHAHRHSGRARRDDDRVLDTVMAPLLIDLVAGRL